LKSIEVEEAVARMFGVRQNIIVPNISWGMMLHECDLLIIRKSGYAVEVEIKVSRWDLRKDLEKPHKHESSKIREFYYAVPAQLYGYATEIVPIGAGIITIEQSKYDTVLGHAEIKRQPKIRRDARKLSTDEISQAARLGCMRIWGLKAKLIRQIYAANNQTEKNEKPNVQEESNSSR
jgi:hypothetical protein